MSESAFPEKAVPDEEAIAIGREIERTLEALPANHRVGFLFGMVLRMLQNQGLNETQVRGELLKGLIIAYASRVPRDKPAGS